MKSRRCSIHAINWPTDEKYATCPLCGEPTRPMENAEPIPDDEAHSLWSHAEFERYYLETRGVPADFEGEFVPEPAELAESQRKFAEIAGLDG